MVPEADIGSRLQSTGQDDAWWGSVGKEGGDLMGPTVATAPIGKEEVVACCLVMFRGILGGAEQRPLGVGVDIRR